MTHLCHELAISRVLCTYLVVDFLQRALGALGCRPDRPGIALHKRPRRVHVVPAKQNRQASTRGKQTNNHLLH